MIHSAIWSEQGMVYIKGLCTSKSKMDTLETNRSVNGSSSLFPPNRFLLTNILKEKTKNPLFLQPNRSFNFGIGRNPFDQYAVSYTHLSTL